MLGSYIIGGSKAGATAAAVWAAHRTLPLNVTGYGRLVGASIEAAQRFRNFLKKLKFNVKGKEVDVYPLDNPDFNMVDWVLKINGETSLEKTNELNEKCLTSHQCTIVTFTQIDSLPPTLSLEKIHMAIHQFHLSRRWALPKMNGTKLVL